MANQIFMRVNEVAEELGVDYLIAYAWHPASNAKDLVEYAERRRKIRKIVVTKIDRFRLNEYN